MSVQVFNNESFLIQILKPLAVGILISWMAWVSLQGIRNGTRITVVETESRINKEVTKNEMQDIEIQNMKNAIDTKVDELEDGVVKEHKKLNDKIDTEIEKLDERIDDLEN